jgi:hypothetical protein
MVGAKQRTFFACEETRTFYLSAARTPRPSMKTQGTIPTLAPVTNLPPIGYEPIEPQANTCSLSDLSACYSVNVPATKVYCWLFFLDHGLVE